VKLIGRICLVFVCSVLAAQQEPAQAPAAPSPVKPQEPENIERMMSISLYDWLPNGGPKFRGGAVPIGAPPHNLALPTKPSRAYGAMLTIPMKGSTRLEVSYETLNDRGNAVAPTDLVIFGGTIPQNEPLAMDYSLRHIKGSWNYLTYPNPPQDAKFRIKTLWEVHYLRLYPTVIATVSGPDQPISAKRSILLPAAGLGLEYVASKHFRLELRGSGMGFPNHSALGDGEGSAVVRVRRLEIFAGAKALYFRTSPKQETYINGLLWGPYGGLRWVFR
jgi:hypothetical protein